MTDNLKDECKITLNCHSEELMIFIKLLNFINKIRNKGQNHIKFHLSSNSYLSICTL